MAEETKPLRDLKRYITDHNDQEQAIFNTSIPEEFVQTTIENGDKFSLGYATNQYPADLSSDLDTYRGYLENNPGVVIPGGSVLRIVDLRPGGESPMHRTVSLDYGVVLEGEIDIVLDSGESRVMKRGDHCVQRGTMHVWRNRSQTQWARMLFVLQEAKPIIINGKELGEDYGVGMANVRPSGH
ncbi:cupin domain-containing protein [Diplogelasinospora grovesii]|uniref:Cupin domain-containing protein n=1 Tax=Diplogelasinospora grovesii TaxID=303347 RepID=A0AAN6N963_9PEZI|nr:cupin domain-containing protein [Diplogelasinospora grovesii]